MSQDAIDLSRATVYSSPPDIASWPITTTIDRLTMRPGKEHGLSFSFGANASWPDYVPPGWEGPIQYTVWAGVQTAGIWHVAGFIQMWRTRPSTGAPILEFWQEWAYDIGRWGPLASVRPKAGDQMIFLLSAGNARRGSAGREPEVTSVRERSNVVIVSLPPGDSGVFTFSPGAQSSATTHPAGHPPPAQGHPPTSAAAPNDAAGTPAAPPDLATVLAEIRGLRQDVQKLAEAIHATREGST
jgi:hypothetical protein